MKDLLTILESLEALELQPFLIGFKILDKNIPENFLLIENPETIYSFSLNNILREEELDGGKTKVYLRPGCSGTITKPYTLKSDNFSILNTIEDRKPPKYVYKKGDPKLATAKDVEKLKFLNPRARTLDSVAANWSGACIFGERESDNCAHFLSDAFIKAGFSELTKNGGESSIKEWCDWNDINKKPDARPIRAKEMWDWFKKMGIRTQRTKPLNSGFWATFQWDRSFSGGHVLLYDSNDQIVYGTGAFWDWSDQFFYQW